MDDASGFFRWRIAAFEDQGRFWDVPIEKVTRYQFERASVRNDRERVRSLETLAERFSRPLAIEANEDAQALMEQDIATAEQHAARWLDTESAYFKRRTSFSLGPRDGPPDLARDLLAYLASQSNDLAEIEARTADRVVLNPNSGEWLKGMHIVLAESGLVTYCGTVVRTPDLFTGIGAKPLRRTYCIHRLAFVRAAFRRAGHSEVVVYRGVASPFDWAEPARSIVSCTFNLRVARSFASFDRADRFRTGYLMKLTVPVEHLWMTHCETAAMNGRYREAEALVLNRNIGPFRSTTS